MIAGTVVFAFATYLLMLVAFFLARRRAFHIPAMIGIMLLDLCMPFYLYMHKDWHRRLIQEGELTSYLLWTHFLLLLTLYILYTMQIQAGRRLLRGEEPCRAEHQAQGKAILVVKGFVVVTGALLVESAPAH